MSSPGKGGESEPGFILFLLGALIFCVLWLIWHAFKGQILELLRWLRYSELWIISLFTSKQDGCVHWLRNVRFADMQPPPQIINWARQCFGDPYLASLPADQQLNYYQLSSDGLGAIEKIVTVYDRWILALILAGIGIWTSFLSPRNQFKTRHTLETFIKAQAKMWPVIAPIVQFNPSSASARKLGDEMPEKVPPFAEAMAPEEWVSWHRIKVANGIPDREATRRAFLLQLGPRWHELDGLPIHIKALLAAFSLKGGQKREESDELLGRLSLSWSKKGGLQLSSDLIGSINKILSDKDLGGKALEVAKAHAYRTTALLGVLRWARLQGGVLAPAQFIWVRAVDRALWYPLNNLGRRSYHTEGAGAMAHFMAEQNAKKPLAIPRIDTAIVTLNQYFATSAQTIPPREGDNLQRT